MGGLISRLTQDKSSSCERAQKDQNLSKIEFQDIFLSLECPLEFQIKHWDLILPPLKSCLSAQEGLTLESLWEDFAVI